MLLLERRGVMMGTAVVMVVVMPLESGAGHCVWRRAGVGSRARCVEGRGVAVAVVARMAVRTRMCVSRRRRRGTAGRLPMRSLLLLLMVCNGRGSRAWRQNRAGGCPAHQR